MYAAFGNSMPRATWVMIVPGSYVSATDRAFSSALHRRRSPQPVMTSTQDIKASPQWNFLGASGDSLLANHLIPDKAAFDNRLPSSQVWVSAPGLQPTAPLQTLCSEP